MTMCQKVTKLQCRMVADNPKKALSNANGGPGEATVIRGVGTVEETAMLSDTVQDLVRSKDPLKASQFAFLNEDMNRIIVAGTMSVVVGSSLEDM